MDNSAATQAPGSWLIGLLGDGIGPSLTPAMHEQEARHLGLAYVYRRIDLSVLRRDVNELASILSMLEQIGFNGLNVTYPCKQAITGLLDELSEDARALQAVNTVVLRDGRRIGHNTDWSGFLESFRQCLPGAQLERVALIGAGGAGCAVGHAAMKLGVKCLTIHDADPAKARTLAHALSLRFPHARACAADSAKQAMSGTHGLIHATPMGMAKLPGIPVPAALLRPDMWVADIVYFPLETGLIRAARDAGCRILGGGGMAVHQAANALRIFTGMTPDVQRMARHFHLLLAD